MDRFSIATNFDRYFSVRYAKTAALRQFAFRIRHQVYAEELHWEPVNDTELEQDSCDDYAHICLLEHRPSGQFAGTVRLVIPPCHATDRQLPFETYASDSVWPHVVDPKRLERGSFSEISRLAVPNSFRRRREEAGKPFILNGESTARVFSEEEARSFPNIAIGLYLASIALVDICHHDHTFVMMEPRLQRHLVRFGLMFEQSGEPLQHHGTRALYSLKRDSLTRYLAPEIAALYELIYGSLNRQLKLVPYGPLQ